MKTFEQIAPLWAAKIKEDFANIKWGCYRDGQELSIGYYECCIVGEAHGFKEDYTNMWRFSGCRDCKKFAMEFDNIADILDIEKYVKTKERFVEHWNEKHI